MITNLGQIYQNSAFRSGKDLRGGFYSPEKFQFAIETVNQRYMNTLVDNFEKSKEVSTDLAPFIKTLGSPQFAALTFTPVLEGDNSKGGYADIPEDLYYEAVSSYLSILNQGCDSTSEYRSVDFVSQHHFDAIMRNSVVSPVLNPENDPVMVFRNNKYFIYPFLRRISFTYIRIPATPYFDYDLISGIPVYLPPGEVHQNSTVEPAGSPSLSVEFEYPENCVDILTDMIKTFMAIGNENQWNIQTQITPKV